RPARGTTALYGVGKKPGSSRVVWMESRTLGTSANPSRSGEGTRGASVAPRLRSTARARRGDRGDPRRGAVEAETFRERGDEDEQSEAGDRNVARRLCRGPVPERRKPTRGRRRGPRRVGVAHPAV